MTTGMIFILAVAGLIMQFMVYRSVTQLRRRLSETEKERDKLAAHIVDRELPAANMPSHLDSPLAMLMRDRGEIP